jgi:predicted transcriptional regulator
MCYYLGIMETNKLITAGLSKNQAEVYALLLEKGTVSPPIAAIKLSLTRTNAYKLLDKLAELGLAVKDLDNKSNYKLGNPTALTTLAASIRAEAVTREEAINEVMKSILTKYHEHEEQPAVEVVSGKLAVANAFRNQINLHENIYFIRSPADIPLMGFDSMHEIRTGPARHGLNRYTIMPDGVKGTINYASHQRSNLDITWVKKEDYNAPVEWSITESSLLIVLYGTEPHAITITNEIIAGSFMQLWHLLDSCLKAMPYYSSLPRTA